jgi:hypothetical protein
VLGIAVGLPIRQSGHELAGIIALEGVSLLTVVGLSLLSKDRFDYSTLHRDTGELETPADTVADPTPAAAG